ncbi:MAG TPA: hypothetical protein VEY88_23015 [Archangium sp.]|nr:hypothetical protein [Archangium sp.]
MWLHNDAAFVAHGLGDLESCRAHLARIRGRVDKVGKELVPKRLAQAIAHNEALRARTP